MPTPVIIDTDPGQDDAVALLLALASPDEIEVLGITTVGGNVPLHLTVRNALIMTELAGRTDVEVHPGCPGPMSRPLVTAEYVHGDTGIDGASFADPSIGPSTVGAVDFIIDALLARDHVTVCTLGPLTNIGTAMQREPRIADRIDRHLLRGGGVFGGGDGAPAAPVDIYGDPGAGSPVVRRARSAASSTLDQSHRPPRTAAFEARGAASAGQGPR